jgi:hypothetical protein
MAIITVRADGTGDYANYYTAIENASAGDTIRLVNDGPHIMPAAANNPSARRIRNRGGTSWADPGLIFEGVDEHGNPAMTTVQADPANSSVAFVSFNPDWSADGLNVSYIWFRGLRFELWHRLEVGTSNPQTVFTFGSSAPSFLRISDCEFWGSNGVDPANSYNYAQVMPSLGSQTGTLPRDMIFENNLVVNMRGLVPTMNSDEDWYVRNNIFITHSITHDPPTNAWVALGLPFSGALADGVRNFTHNTILHIASNVSNAVSNGGQYSQQMYHHSNLYYLERRDPVNNHNQLVQTGYNRAAAAVGQMGHDLFCVSPSFPRNWTSSTAHGYGTYEFNEDFPGGGAWDSRDLHSLSEAHDLEFADLFNDTSAPWDWIPNDYTHELPYDLRPTVGRTLALDGSVAGAVQDDINTAPVITGNQTWSVTAGNTLEVDASSGLAAVSYDPDSDPLTWSIVDNVTHGTLSLVTNTGAYSYTPNLSYEGPDQFTWEVTDGVVTTSFITGTSDRPVVAFTVDPYPVVDPGEGSGAVDPVFLDVLPFFAPDRRVDMVMRLRTKRNRRVHHLMREGFQNERWYESTHRIVHVATNTTRRITLGGVEVAKYLMIETDEPIEVAVNTNTAYWPVTGAVALLNTDVRELHVRNTSTDTVAIVQVAVVD